MGRTSFPSTLIVIPARYASSRFPGKPLVSIAGMTMLERVWRIAKACAAQPRVVIATDNQEIEAAGRSFGAEVVQTSAECRTGTDRVAEAFELLGGESELVFSFQGDAVLTPPWLIDAVLNALAEDPELLIATPAVRLEGEALNHFREEKKRGSSSGTSVVFDRNHDALYFSKALLPWSRNSDAAAPVYRHIGLYGYRREGLRRFTQLPPGKLEQVEQLEQLRALEHGIKIRVVEVDFRGRTHGSVDRPEDVPVVEQIIAREGELLQR